LLTSLYESQNSALNSFHMCYMFLPGGDEMLANMFGTVACGKLFLIVSSLGFQSANSNDFFKRTVDFSCRTIAGNTLRGSLPREWSVLSIWS